MVNLISCGNPEILDIHAWELMVYQKDTGRFEQFGCLPNDSLGVGRFWEHQQWNENVEDELANLVA